MDGLVGEESFEHNRSPEEGPVMEKRDLGTPDQILKEALRREKEARDFYGDLAIDCRVDFVKKLLERLKEEESKHVRLVESMITKHNLGREIR
ncbi:MAG: ferritin family protein [Thermodesulfobacteriota bacterium]